jgi:hypothetical protein
MDMSFEQKILLENNQKCQLWKYGSVYFGQMQMGWQTFEQLIIWFTDLWMCKFANMDIDQLTIFYLHLFDQMSVSQMVFKQKALIGNDPKFLSALNMLIKGRLADRLLADMMFGLHICASAIWSSWLARFFQSCAGQMSFGWMVFDQKMSLVKQPKMPALKTRLCIFWLKANWPKVIAPMRCLADRYVAPLLV